jgi:hypothetical protein
MSHTERNACKAGAQPLWRILICGFLSYYLPLAKTLFRLLHPSSHLRFGGFAFSTI